MRASLAGEWRQARPAQRFAYLAGGALMLGPLAAVRTMAGGEAWFDPGVAPRLLERYRRLVAPASRREAKLASHADREHDVLRLMPRGAANTEIAVAMHVAEATVKTHAGSIFAKLGPRDRAAAIIFAATTVWSRPASRHRSSATLHPRREQNPGPRADAHRNGVAAVAQSPREEGAGSR
jgi:DNA-binding CsgD family transcriptional regulator